MLAKAKRYFRDRAAAKGRKAGRTFAERCIDASTALSARGYDADSAHLLAFYPYVARNPFQKMLYSAGYENGFACFDARNPSEMAEGPANQSLLSHYHWVNRVFRGVRSSAEARLAVRSFLASVRSQKDAGHSLMWTIHNILSHGSDFPEEEANLRAEMAHLMDHIHIMNPDTVSLCKPYYDVPAEKVFHVPHPSYHRVYGDYLSKAEARHTLGLRSDDHVFLLFGNMMPQKGAIRFLEQLDALQEKLKGRARVVLAGKPSDEAYLGKVFAKTLGRTDVQLHQGYLDDQALQVYFRAADVVVCPYAITLNSGVVMTAASFGCPVVVPDSLAGILADVGSKVMTYEIGNMDACIEACAAALDISHVADTEVVLTDWAQKLSPRKVSNHFFETLRGRL